MAFLKFHHPALHGLLTIPIHVVFGRKIMIPPAQEVLLLRRAPTKQGSSYCKKDDRDITVDPIQNSMRSAIN